MTTETEFQDLDFRETERVVSRVLSVTGTDMPRSEAETVSTERLLDRFGSWMLPFVVAASLAAPVEPRTITRTFSRAGTSRSSIAPIPWLLEDWAYSEEPIDMEQVRALNALLALPIEEGFSLDLNGD